MTLTITDTETGETFEAEVVDRQESMSTSYLKVAEIDGSRSGWVEQAN